VLVARLGEVQLLGTGSWLGRLEERLDGLGKDIKALNALDGLHGGSILVDDGAGVRRNLERGAQVEVGDTVDDGEAKVVELGEGSVGSNGL
jgi:hypothetical protein